MIDWLQGLWQSVQGGWIWFWQMDGWQPSLAIASLAAAFVCIFAGLFKTAYNHGKRDAAVPVPIETRPRYVREVEYVAANAWAGREVWNEPREQESEERE